MKILLAVDGSPFTKKMLAYLAAHPEFLADVSSITALTVQPALPPRARAALGKEMVDSYHADEAAKVKFWSTDREWELLDIGVQLHGGYGYITEYPIARAFLDARVHRIYGGTNEIMRDIVSRQIVGKR